MKPSFGTLATFVLSTALFLFYLWDAYRHASVGSGLYVDRGLFAAAVAGSVALLTVAVHLWLVQRQRKLKRVMSQGVDKEVAFDFASASDDDEGEERRETHESETASQYVR